MDRRKFISSALMGAGSIGASTPLQAAIGASKFKRYNGIEVTQVTVFKSQRVMVLSHHSHVLRRYEIDLGFMPEGHKQFLGDGKTPEGVYWINRRNPNSKYHLSLGISYPNKDDVKFAQAHGKKPGGNIFIHGGPRTISEKLKGRDWTAGCIAVTDSQIEDIYAMVPHMAIAFIQP